MSEVIQQLRGQSKSPQPDKVWFCGIRVGPGEMKSAWVCGNEWWGREGRKRFLGEFEGTKIEMAMATRVSPMCCVFLKLQIFKYSERTRIF